MRRSRAGGVVVALSILLVPASSLADRGWIPVPPWPQPTPPQPVPPPGPLPPQPVPPPDPADWVPGPYRALQIEEPTQQAVIAWNGREEILVLSTHVKASQKTMLLEVLPLPAQPQVDKGDAALFDKACQLLRHKNQERQPRRLLGAAPGEITLQKKIGAHDISVAHVLEEQGFVAWVEGYLKQKLAATARPVITQTTREVIGQYLRDGFKYFAFDLIQAESELAAHDAIRYRFATKYLYYPLRISRSGGAGHTRIQLVVLTPGLLNYYKGLPASEIKPKYQTVDVSADELRALSGEIAELFGGQGAKLRLWELSGPLAGFTGDVQVSDRPLPPADE